MVQVKKLDNQSTVGRNSRKNFMKSGGQTAQRNLTGAYSSYNRKSRPSVNVILAEIVDIQENGLCFAVGPNQDTIGFRLELLSGYAGQKPSEIGLVKGAKIKIVQRRGRVLKVHLAE